MNIDSFVENYSNRIHEVFKNTELQENIRLAAWHITETIYRYGTIYVCGNGGSAAIADHLTCDCLKGIRTDTIYRPRVVSLCSNGPLLTAIANDISYDQVFKYQLESLLTPDDLLITISSSGTSPNIVNAFNYAVNICKTITFSGFNGGGSKLIEKPTVSLHVPENNYGIVEDCHQMIMHMIAQYIRVKNAKESAPLIL